MLTCQSNSSVGYVLSGKTEFLDQLQTRAPARANRLRLQHRAA